MSHRVTLIPGDGVGPEITAATRRVIEATGVAIEWEEAVKPIVEGAGLLPRPAVNGQNGH